MSAVFVPSMSSITSKNHQYSTASDDTMIWHHDCSNLTMFDKSADESWLYASNSVITGSLNSSGSYIYCDDYGSGPQTYGPLQYYTFPEPFPLSQLNHLAVEIEMNHSTSAGVNGGGVWLFDENNVTIFNIQAQDSWDTESYVRPYVHWRFQNDTGTGTPYDVPALTAPESFHRTLTCTVNESGAYVDFPSVLVSELLTSEDIDYSRMVTHIGINLRALTPYEVMDTFRIHDIELSWTGLEDDWLDGWSHRTSHVIHGSLGAGEDYQIPITVNFGVGVSTGDMIYVNNNAQPDFDDIRFTDD
ncbi:MAG: hypothetical protein RTU30_15035, partial [Candidatus Thorarchaeota archaeon]